MVSNLVLIYFGRPPIGHTMKINCIKSEALDLEISSVLSFINRSGTSFPTTIQYATELVSPPPHFVFEISRKLFLMLHSVN